MVLRRWISRVSTRVRLAVIDVARGLALVAMATFHGTWDLGFLQLTPENFALTDIGRWSARAIAASFLVLVGVSLVLAHGRGLRPRPYLRRLAQVAGAALAITLATRVLFPDSYIFFGVLHCIAAASVLALPFLRPPTIPAALLAAVVAALAFAAPLAPMPALFDAPPLAFLGLGTRALVTNDYVPLLPWSGFVLAGLAAARIGLPRLAASRLGAWVPHHRVPRALAFAGRHSLAIYLLHQPLLLGLAYAWLALAGPNPTAEAAPFRRGYEAQCMQAGGAPATCRATTLCLVDRLKAEGLWRAAAHDGLTAEARTRAIRLATECYGAASRTP